MENLNEILVFKTNIKTVPDHERVKVLFDANPDIEQWNVDRKDVDCVLRIVSHQVKSKDIIQLLAETGYQCQELE
jgi:hypothetical protein